MQKFQFCPFCGKKLRKNKQGYLSCSCGYIHYENARPTATAFILNDKNELLLGKRTIEPYKGWWNVIGGFLTKDEDPKVGAIREAKEETGLDVEIGDFVGIVTGCYDEPVQGHYYTFNIYYEAKIKGGKLKTDHEANELKFFPLKKLPKKVAFGNDKKAIKLLREKLHL